MQANPSTSEEELCSVHTAKALRQCISFGSLQMTTAIVFLSGSPCVTVRLFVTNDWEIGKRVLILFDVGKFYKNFLQNPSLFKILQ